MRKIDSAVEITLREWCHEVGRYGPLVQYHAGTISLYSHDSSRHAEFKGSMNTLTSVVLRGGEYEFKFTTTTMDDQMKEMVLQWVIQGLRS
jgi:hypothetical protein